MKRFLCGLSLLSALCALSGCATGSGSFLGRPPLRVGIKPDYPPIVFKQGYQVVGVEPDFARLIGAELGRPVEFVEMGWDQLVPALLDGKIDLIMSGMSITEVRRVRIDFTDAYLEAGQMALVRAKDASRYDSAESVMGNSGSIGVQKGSTAETFVREKFPMARAVSYLTAADAVVDLLNRRRVDMYVDDAPAIRWLASEHEASLAPIPIPLTQEQLAWGVRRSDTLLREDINGLVKRWREDGTLDRVLKRWMPYM